MIQCLIVLEHFCPCNICPIPESDDCRDKWCHREHQAYCRQWVSWNSWFILSAYNTVVDTDIFSKIKDSWLYSWISNFSNSSTGTKTFWSKQNVKMFKIPDPDRSQQRQFKAPEVQILQLDPGWHHHLQHWPRAIQALVSGHHPWPGVHVRPSGIQWLSTMRFRSNGHNSALPSSSWVGLLGQQGPGSSLDTWVIDLIDGLKMNKNIAEQPKYIQSIVGYSPTTGRTYFKDKKGKAYLSTFDGVRMDVVNPSNMATVGLFWLTFVN